MNIPRRNFIQVGAAATAGAALFGVGTTGAASRERSVATTADLKSDFVSIPDSAKPCCYWWWFNGLVNKEGITRDLEEFRAKGIGGVLLVNSASGLGGARMPQGAKFLSPEWREFYRHALQEAHRLGIEVGINLCAGWCMGGPWIPPEHSGRWVLQSKLVLTGPMKFSDILPLPGNRDGYNKVSNPPGYKAYIDLPLEKLDYRDTAVVAFPENEGRASRFSGERAALLSAKTNRKDASNFTRARDVIGPTLAPWTASPSDEPIPSERVVDLSSKMRPDGHLDWEVPAGRWVIVRTGHRMTGSRLMIAPPEADGLSVDWFSREGVELQFENLAKVLLAEAGPLVGTTLKYFCDDSFEDGFPNWTEKLIQEFERYRGYDPRPYLPVLAGYMIGSAEQSDRFLHDYRRTIADCMADGHYGRFAELCREHGLLVQNEAAGPSRSGTICMDGLMNLGRSDMPMGEFWLGLKHDEPGGLDPALGYGITRLEDGQNKVTKMAASAAHIYGRRTASAEAFTTWRHWKDSPATLKPAADRAFCEGINRLVIHASTATRPGDGKPGYGYGAGTHFNPNVTWWNKAGPFLAYLGRCQRLLQEGRFVADVLFYNGDWAPNLVEPKHVDPSLGKGFDYDACNAEVLLTRLSVKHGRIVLPDGMSYRLLALPERGAMPVEVVARIRQLVKAGATVVGPRPDRAPGLKNFPNCDREVQAIAAEVWGDCDGRIVTRNKFGKGRVFWGVTLREILLSDGVQPDFEHPDAGAFIDFIHRSTDGLEIYFLVNRNNRSETLECTFRASNRQPEIWDPVSGETRKAEAFRQERGRTVVPLEFAPYQSLFVAFRKPGFLRAPGKIGGSVDNFVKLISERELPGPWTVRFDPQWGGPESIEFLTLDDWTHRPEAGIRHYSGTATYVKRFDFGTKPGGQLFLDLGRVKDVAEVRLNGRPLGVVWTAPWRVEITGSVQAKDNLLEIEVVNLWPNRLIGDAALPPEKRLGRTNIQLEKNAPLLPSGLLGPVSIQRVAAAVNQPF